MAVALVCSALLVVFYLRIRDFWLRRQAERAPTDHEVSLLLQVFQMVEDIIAITLAVVLAGVAFVIDLWTISPINAPILYLVPLCIIAITRSRWLLWLAVPLLTALSYYGYIWGPPEVITPDVAQRVAINRAVAVGALIATAVLIHFVAAPGKTTPAHE